MLKQEFKQVCMYISHDHIALTFLESHVTRNILHSRQILQEVVKNSEWSNSKF